LLAAKQQGDRSFAGEFDLALCYAGTVQYHAAIEVLQELEAKNPKNANIYSLLSQVYVWSNNIPEALAALKKAAALAPKNEKLYLLLDDACMERGQYSVGLDVANLGLRSLPNSPGLLYQRGMFLTLLDQFDTGKLDLERAAELGHGTEVGFLASAQKASFEGNMPEVVRVTREGTKKHESEALLTMLGVALVRLGASPGQAEFSEAQTALEKAVKLRPDVATSRIALGKIYLLGARIDDAIVQLEAARQLDSSIAAVYSNLARAYQQRGDQAKAQQMLSELSSLNQEQGETIRSAPGERKSSYLGSRSGHSQPPPTTAGPVAGEKHE
jgi:predicted Zn-dependent protease